MFLRTPEFCHLRNMFFFVHSDVSLPVVDVCALLDDVAVTNINEIQPSSGEVHSPLPYTSV